MKLKTKTKTILIFAFCYFIGNSLFFNTAFALEINDFAFGSEGNGFSAESYVVMDKNSEQILVKKAYEKNWSPASLTKLVTALVVLDFNPKLEKNIFMKKEDEVGGARIYTKSGVSYKTKDLFASMLIASANNSANALARSMGVSKKEFVKLMNKKALSLGAKNTEFVDPSGISQKSKTTAEDFVKIAKKAFENEKIVEYSKKVEYSFSAQNNKNFRHKIKNTNQLLGNQNVNIISGKTGFLNESKYNFAGLIKDQFGQESLVVILGAKDKKSQFNEAKELIFLAGLVKSSMGIGGMVLGESIKN